jgi:molybdopterin-guanine dinucleotide biosynthesis protein A
MKRSHSVGGSGSGSAARLLSQTAVASAHKILAPGNLERYGGVRSDHPVLLILAAGKGTRFGRSPKCAQKLDGIPLARYSIDAFRNFCSSPVICVVGYRHEEVMAALGDDNVYVRSDNHAGGTAFASFEAFSVAALPEKNPLLVITMGDRVVTPAVFRKLCETHMAGLQEAELTLLTAEYEPPKNQGKGRVVRDAEGKVLRIIEQRDIDLVSDGGERQALLDLKEGNCPLYAIRAETLRRYLSRLNNDNAQQQYYLTDIVAAISEDGGEVRTLTTTPSDPEYDLLCADVTRPMDIALLEGILRSNKGLFATTASGLEEAACVILADRPTGQVASIARQLKELFATVERERFQFQADQPVAIGISGGRLRLAFMHPDMGRFFGPAWQMPIGAGDAAGEEQIVLLAQSSEDGKIHLYPTNPEFREKLNFVPADDEHMYPGAEVADWYSYEDFGTRMAENLLLSLGYFTDEELGRRRERKQPLPPPALWISNSMRRPFSLLANAIASMRTLRKGNLGARVQAHLGKASFRGLRLVSTGDIPQGGFSSSSAVTVAVKNALNALFDLGVSPDLLVHLACQAEYGTGVRAGSLDQATEQKGRAGQGTLISSNPGDNYRIIGTYPVPASRYHLLFPYSVDRDRAAWQWSWGVYAAAPEPGRLTAGEVRKMTGKASELAAILVRLPLETDFFKQIEEELVANGVVGQESRRWVCGILRQLPMLISQEELRQRVFDNRHWLVEQLIEVQKLDRSSASAKAEVTLENLFTGWRNPVLRRGLPSGSVAQEAGVPLRAMLAYLFFEVAKNFYLIHHPDLWIEYVSRSQWGDRCVQIDHERLPSKEKMMSMMEWERGCEGAALMERWLEAFEAKPFDFNQGLEDSALTDSDQPDLHLMPGGNFFRGLALIDLAEAMLKRAFGGGSIAVRINAAGQGDFFQVHVDTESSDVEEVKRFIRSAFYRRFGLVPARDFVEVRPGGGAVGIRLNRFDQVPELIFRLRQSVRDL